MNKKDFDKVRENLRMELYNTALHITYTDIYNSQIWGIHGDLNDFGANNKFIRCSNKKKRMSCDESQIKPKQ